MLLCITMASTVWLISSLSLLVMGNLQSHFCVHITQDCLSDVCSLGVQEFAVRKDNLQCFLTYADNNAVGYFAKQGFTKEITFDRERVRAQQKS